MAFNHFRLHKQTIIKHVILFQLLKVSTEKNKKLENLATVMTLYSRRTFSKESFQWTK